MSTFLQISLRNLLHGKMYHFINGNTMTYPTQSIDSFTEFLFFVSYPGCGPVCEDIFREMRTILNLKGTSYLMVKFPKFVKPESEYNDYHKENGVTWPWVRAPFRSEVTYPMQIAGIVETQFVNGAKARAFLQKYNNVGQAGLFTPARQNYGLAVGF